MSTSRETGATDKTVLQVHVVNHGGEHCARALKAVTTWCDLPALASWRSSTGRDLGNCFFSTTHAALDLVRNGMTEDCLLVTGRFDHQDLPEPVYHCWLEFRHVRPWVVVNLSNLHEKPLYAVERDTYLQLNACKKRIQEIPLKRLRIKAAQMSKKAQDATGDPGFDLRHFTHRVLAPTLALLPDIQTGKDAGAHEQSQPPTI